MKTTKNTMKMTIYSRSPKCDYLTKKRDDAGTKHFNDPNAFIECLNTMNDVYENIDDYNPNRQRKV